MGTVKKATPLPKQDGFQMQTLSDVVKRSERTDHQVFDGGEVLDVEVATPFPPHEVDVIHKLGKVPSGFVIINTDTLVIARQVSADKLKIRLQFSTTCNAKVMVF